MKPGNNDRTQVTPLTTSTITHPLSFFRVLAQGWNNFGQHGLGSPKIPHLCLKRRRRVGVRLFPQDWHSNSCQAKTSHRACEWQMYQKLTHALVTLGLIVYSISFLGPKNTTSKFSSAFSKNIYTTFFSDYTMRFIFRHINLRKDLHLFLHILCLTNYMQLSISDVLVRSLI